MQTPIFERLCFLIYHFCNVKYQCFSFSNTFYFRQDVAFYFFHQNKSEMTLVSSKMVIDHVSLVQKPDSSSTERLLARQICVAGTGNFDRRKSNMQLEKFMRTFGSVQRKQKKIAQKVPDLTRLNSIWQNNEGIQVWCSSVLLLVENNS